MTSKKAFFSRHSAFPPWRKQPKFAATYLRSGVSGPEHKHHTGSGNLNSDEQSEFMTFFFFFWTLLGGEVESGPAAPGQSRVDAGPCVHASASAHRPAQTAAAAAHRLKRSWTFCANSFFGGSFKRLQTPNVFVFWLFFCFCFLHS